MLPREVLSPLARWVLKELVKNRAWLVFLGGSGWVPGSTAPRIELGLPSPRRHLPRQRMNFLEDMGFLERTRLHVNAYADPRRLTREGWRVARELLSKADRKAVPEEMPLDYP